MLPDGAKYSAYAVKWYDENNERVDTAKAGYMYKAVFTLTILDNVSDWFEAGYTRLPTGMMATVAENKRSMDITYTYRVPGEKEPVEDESEETESTAQGTETTETTTTEAPETESGCGAAVGGMGIAVITVSIIGVCLVKRKED